MCEAQRDARHEGRVEPYPVGRRGAVGGVLLLFPNPFSTAPGKGTETSRQYCMLIALYTLVTIHGVWRRRASQPYQAVNHLRFTTVCGSG